MGTVQYHRIPAIRAHQQPGIFVLLIEVIAATFVLPYSLDDVPDFSGHQCGVGILEDQALLPGMLNPPLILVRFCTVPHVDGVAQICLVFQDCPDRISTPMVRLIQIQAGMSDVKAMDYGRMNGAAVLAYAEELIANFKK